MKHYAFLALEPVACAVALISAAAAFAAMRLSPTGLVIATLVWWLPPLALVTAVRAVGDPTPTPLMMADVLGHLAWWFLGPLTADLLLPGLAFGGFWPYAVVIAMYTVFWITPMFVMVNRDLGTSG